MSNSESNGDIIYLCDDIFDFSTISGVFFILIFIFSIAGNGLLLCVVVSRKNLKHFTKVFVLNLACSDLVFTLTLPFWATYFLHHWVFGDFACKFLIWAYNVGMYSSVIILTAMTVDRFITVVLNNWPSYNLRRQRCATGACTAAWVISIAASVGEAINMEVETGWDDLKTCLPSSGETMVQLGYYLQVSLLFFLPFVIIVFCYAAILKKVLQSSNRRRHKTVAVVLCIVAVFFICWGPYNVLIFIEALYKPQGCAAIERFSIVSEICQILAFSHCCMNPLLYLLSQTMRQHLFDMLRCKKLHGKKAVQHKTEIELLPV